jgi:hypothetical protein
VPLADRVNDLADSVSSRTGGYRQLVSAPAGGALHHHRNVTVEFFVRGRSREGAGAHAALFAGAELLQRIPECLMATLANILHPTADVL